MPQICYNKRVKERHIINKNHKDLQMKKSTKTVKSTKKSVKKMKPITDEQIREVFDEMFTGTYY